MDNFWPYSTILDHIWPLCPFWNILNHIKPFWTIFDHIRHIWTLLIIYIFFALFQTILNIFFYHFDRNGRYCNIWDPLKPFQFNLGQIEIFWIIQTFFEISLTSWTYFGPIWTILNYFGLCWIVLDCFGLWWLISDPLGPFRTIFVKILNHFGHF